jgi:DNA polymerase elongation subunit (family B)
MSAKKNAKDLKSKAAGDDLKNFAARGQAAQTAVEGFEDPEQILGRFRFDVMECCRRLKRHQSYFLERKINPFQRLQIICQQNTLHLQDNFDKVAGLKAED